jgi:predicted metal-dependent hydrolase
VREIVNFFHHEHATYLQGYPESLLSQVTAIEQDRLGEVLQKRYPHARLNSDKALYQYTQDLKTRFLRGAAPINKVMYDNKIHVLNNALGLHTADFPRSGRQAESQSGNPRGDGVSRRAGSLSADDRGA